MDEEHVTWLLHLRGNERKVAMVERMLLWSSLLRQFVHSSLAMVIIMMACWCGSVGWNVVP